LGYLSDGSFSAGVARIPEKALFALVEDLIPAAENEALTRQLYELGLADIS